MAIAKVQYKENASATPEVWMDTTQKTVTSGTMLSGTTALKNDGTGITGNIASKSSSDLTASGATVTAPAGYYATEASKSVASGTAGTPTATKGTVSNHSISVTPSVTNTTGYIAGSTINGTAVTVNVSELESGTKTITENGTGISVSGYSAVDVAVPTGGGSGLEYEEGTWTPAADVTVTSIEFENAHSVAPFYFMISDATAEYSSTTSSIYNVVYYNFDQLFGVPYQLTSDGTSFHYGYVYRRYRNSATALTGGVISITYPYTTSASNANYYPRYWVQETGITAKTGNSEYWRTGRTYKWIAVWAPTT